MPIIGTVEVCRSFSFKITGDANPHSGMGKFETKDFFSSYKASTTPEDLADVSAMLYAMAEQDVMTVAARHQNFTLLPPPDRPPDAAAVEQTVPAPVTVQASQTAPAPPQGGYVVAEKPAPAPTQAPATDAKPAAVVAERLKELGLSKEDLMKWLRVRVPDSATRKLTQDEYVAVFTEAEVKIKATSLAEFLKLLEDPTTPASADDVFTQDAAVKAALAQITAKWPTWSPELTKIAALWCADQVKDAAALEAFLIAGGMNDQTPGARIEAFLAITRHMAFSAGKDVLEYSKKSGDPLSLIEDTLSKSVGQPIRFALGIPQSHVPDQFAKLVEALEKKKGVGRK